MSRQKHVDPNLVARTMDSIGRLEADPEYQIVMISSNLVRLNRRRDRNLAEGRSVVILDGLIEASLERVNILEYIIKKRKPLTPQPKDGKATTSKYKTVTKGQHFGRFSQRCKEPSNSVMHRKGSGRFKKF